jgi:hypothetical protein
MSLPDALKNCTTYPGATEAAIRTVERALGRPLPDDYKKVLNVTNGVEGPVGSDAYLALWHAEEIASLNVASAVSEFMPDLTLIGSNGGDDAYGFLAKDGEIEYVCVPFIFEKEAITPMGRTFDDFLRRLSEHPPM